MILISEAVMEKQVNMMRTDNKNAQKGDESMTSMISFRCTPRLKSGAVKAAQKEGMKLQEWLTKLIEENTK